MRVLVIAEFIAPVRSIASIRWTKLSKYLSMQYGMKIDILTNQKHYCDSVEASFYQYDKTLEDELRFFERVFTIPEGASIKIINLIFRLADRILRHTHTVPAQRNSKPIEHNRRTDKSTFFEKLYKTSFRAALSIKGYAFQKNAKKTSVNFSHYDVIISTFGPIWTHKIAADAKLENPSALWIADYRDSAIYSPDINDKHRKHIAHLYNEDADIITTVWRNEPDILGIPPNKNRYLLTNGYDPDDIVRRHRTKSDKFIISYTGSLYNDNSAFSDLFPALKAVSKLAASEKLDINDVEFVYAGVSGNEFEKQTAAFTEIPKRNLGIQPREIAMQIQDSSSLLLLCTWNVDGVPNAITGKIFEYLSSSVPVLGICSGTKPDSDVKDMLERAHAGFCYEAANDEIDYSTLEQFVLDKYREWKYSGITSCNTNWDYVKSFGYDILANKVHRIIQEAIAREHDA